MGSSSSLCYQVVLPKPLLLMVRIVDGMWLPVSKALFHLGLRASCEPLLAPSWDHVYQLPSMENNLHAMAASPPPTATPSTVKERLPVVEFASWSERYGDEEEEEPMCAVCLGGLDARDEVRELGNCLHAFHKECIDEWADLGQLTCPLCRSQLLPTELPRGEQKGPLISSFLSRLYIYPRGLASI